MYELIAARNCFETNSCYLHIQLGGIFNNSENKENRNIFL